MNENLPVVASNKKVSSFTNKALVAGVAALPLFAFAEGIDVTEGTAQLAFGLTAVGALGAAKLAPSALTWVWSLVTRMAAR